VDGLDDRERARLLEIARAALDLARAPHKDRDVTISADGSVATVTFHPSPNMLAGEFVVKINRDSGRVVDLKLGR
jgi:hypothetical protein